MNKLKKLLLITLTFVLMSLTLSTIANAQDYYSPEDAGWLFVMSAAICVIFVLIWFIVFIAIAIWVYKDAEKRGSSGALWLIIVILLGIIGIIIWLIVRPPIGGHPQQQQYYQPPPQQQYTPQPPPQQQAPPPQQTGRFCTNCGKPIPQDAQVCPYCGKDYRQQ